MEGSDSESAVAAGLARALEKEGCLTWGVCSPKLMDHLQSKGFRPRNSLNEFNADFVFCVKCDTLKGTEF